MGTTVKLPASSRPAVHPPAKKTITAWRALVWAYADENVRAANAHLVYRDDGRSRYAGYASEKATVSGYLAAHADAIAVDAMLKGGLDGYQYTRIARAAEQRVPIPAKIELPPPRIIPVLNRRGRPDVLLNPASGKPWYCPVKIIGFGDAQARDLQSAQLAMHRIFVWVLDEVARMPFERWVIRGRGIDSLGESLDRGAQASA